MQFGLHILSECARWGNMRGPLDAWMIIDSAHASAQALGINLASATPIKAIYLCFELIKKSALKREDTHNDIIMNFFCQPDI